MYLPNWTSTVDPTQKAAVRHATIAAIAETQDVSKRVRELAAFRKNAPARFCDEWEQYNPLLWLAEEHPDIWESVQVLIHDKRLAARQGDAIDSHKLAYMRTLMAQRRSRVAKAVRLENARRGERDQLRGSRRETFAKRMLKQWSDEADAYVQSMAFKNNAYDGASRRKFRADFWETVDATLDKELREAGLPTETGLRSRN